MLRNLGILQYTESLPCMPRWEISRRELTCGASFQTGSVGAHQPRISALSGLTHPHLEWAAGDVAAVELHIDGVDAILTGDEANGVLV